tara:strand:- start:355 stop:744 length:390 start_codon:yes stop_codon:yes gene_type:complete
MANKIIGQAGEAIEPNYDYGDIKQRDKEVVLEIIKWLRERNGVPVDMLIEELKIKFQLEEVPMKKVEETVWGQLTKGEKLGASIQGYREITDKDGKRLRIPHIGFSADLDYLDEFLNRIVEKANKIKEK